MISAPPCGHPFDHPAVAGCGYCRVRHIPAWKDGWAKSATSQLRGAKKRPVTVPASPTVTERKPCIYLGPPTGELVECRTCNPNRNTRIKLRQCQIHGECTERTPVIKSGGTKVRRCADCPDYAARQKRPGEIVLNMGAGGLGDSVQGLLVSAGLKAERPESHVVYRCSGKVIPFVGLFDGYDELIEHDWDRHGGLKLRTGDRQLNEGYFTELSTKSLEPRWMRYLRNAGVKAPAIPKLRNREAVLSAGRDLAGAVVLCPFSNFSDREYPVRLWLELERMLHSAGYRTVILDESADKIRSFSGVKVAGQPAERVAGILLNATVIIGNDSGLSHLGGVLGSNVIVLCAQTSGEKIYGCYPNARWLTGSMGCGGCYWQHPHNPRKCRPSCPNLLEVTPARILAEVDHIHLSQLTAGRTLVSLDRLSVLRNETLRTNSLPGDVAELGVYRGGTAKLLRHYMTGGTLHLFDTFNGIPERDAIPGGHNAGEFACSLSDVQGFLSDPNIAYHVGPFPSELDRDDSNRYRLVHLDADTYQSTAAGLDYFSFRMVPGGVIILDDYQWANCPGVERAVHERFDPGRIETRATYQAVVRF